VRGKYSSRIKIVLEEWPHCFGDEGDVTVLISYPRLCWDFLIFEFPIFTPAIGVRVIFEILFTLRQSRLGLRNPIINLSICSTIFIYLFFLSINGGAGGGVVLKV